MTRGRPRPALEALALLAIAAFSVWLHPAPYVLARNDERVYRDWGLSFAHHRPPAFWSPLYALQYWLESLVTGGSEARLADLHWILLLSGCLAVFWVLLRTAGLGALATGLVTTALSLLAWSNQTIHVSLLATVILGGALIRALRQASLSEGLPWLAGGSVLATFVRPELALSAALLVSLTAWTRQWRALLVIGGLLVALVLAFGVPYGPDRTWMAFWQQYGANVATSRELPSSTYSVQQDLFRADFGDSASLSDAFHRNRPAFLWHLRVNAAGFPNLPVDLFALDGTLGTALQKTPLIWMVLHLLFPFVPLFLIGLGVPIAIITGHRARVPRLLALSLGITLLPLCLSGLLLMPKPRYFVPALPPLLALAAWGGARLREIIRSRRTSGVGSAVRAGESRDVGGLHDAETLSGR